ncbi:MAG: histidine kinase [Actinomycetota bacterium]|nr:histidine kinase [Actinomycetota bacterium]
MRRRRLAAVLAALVVALTVASLVLTLYVGWSFTQALNAFVVSNLVIGFSFGMCGAFIAWHRPEHPVGWMYVVGGLFQLFTAVCAPLAQAMQDAGASRLAVELAVTVFAWAWPVHIGVVLPLSLFLLPDGRLPSPRWRPVVAVIALTAPLFLVEVGTGVQLKGLPNGLWTLPRDGVWTVVWSISELRWSVGMLIGLGALGVRYRNGDETVRRQLLWLQGAAGIILAAVLPWALMAGTPIAVLFAIPLLPLAIAIAILRHGLLDIRVVLARGLSYALLSGLVLVGYAVLVLALSGVASALLVALLAFPLRARIQSAVERLMYGERDPLRVASRVGVRLTDLALSIDEVRQAMQLPFVAVVAGGQTVASAGKEPERVVHRSLGNDAELVIGLRTGEQRLTPSDDRVLELLAGPLSVALAATITSRDLQRLRERLIAAREEERLRLRRDLHDGLGPLLTGVALAADAAANLQSSAPEDAAQLLRSVRTDTRTAIAEVRRVVEDLRPPALAELGLNGALEARAAQTSRRADGQPLHITVKANAFDELPPAIEVAAYRIATEALNNVVRHSSATSVSLSVCQDRDLLIEVLDNGRPDGAWSPGVGMSAMRERAAELGGTCEIGPSHSGGAVRARLPVASG